MLDEKKVEALKVWYALFGTILDMKELSDSARLDKLVKLRQEIERAVGGIQ